MLEKLSSIPWNELQHAYGEASEVPDMIRALASPEEEIYKAAIDRLWYTVIHQGTVYSATAYVVPFFCELLDAPDVHNKAGLLYYLATIARGASYADVHVQEKERRETPEMQKKLAEELSWVQATSAAVSDGFACYVRLLHSPDPQIRVYAAHTLSRCQSHEDEVVRVMKQQFQQEEAQIVRASLLLSLGLLLPANEDTVVFFTHLLREPGDPLIQITAGIACAFSMKNLTSQEALRTLIQGYELSPDVKKQFVELAFADSDLDSCISTALLHIGLSIAPLVVPTLIRVVRKSDAWNGIYLVPSLLFFTLEGKKIKRGMTVSDLTDLQRDALTAIYETEELWRFVNMSYEVGNFFDPKFLDSNYSIWSRNDLGAFLSGQKVFHD